MSLGLDQIEYLSTLRNRDFIASDVQQRLGQSKILVAGCGSTGGSIIEPLVRTGARHLVLAENGTYEVSNLNRQSMGIAHVGRNKASVHAARVRFIHPGVQVTVHDEGIQAHNVEQLVRETDLIVDGVDVTTRDGLQAKYLLHAHAKEQRKLLITGYDMAAAQLIVVHDYRQDSEQVMKGRLTPLDIVSLHPLQCCIRLIGTEQMPLEIFEELERHARHEKDFISQLAMTANLFGVLALGVILKSLAEEPLPETVYLDIWELLGSQSDEHTLSHYRQHWANRHDLHVL
ncbi:ThiF family adenylyltransferase [Pokkaliibacter sp. MBI-7]|uniref:HesA/MoeB/ThiF family protein n=1 Tax=Pokkaliibacter sp. MBI-7 TaxID=3040600 RepID=UPI0024484554|nr:ThiF family adenylyltransferase [Pokkaliibacter sp. MBI-7]MDH2432430.1 ThiF family adenylyltransferase [Pokkaliibacter sp. MBI-7]